MFPYIEVLNSRLSVFNLLIGIGGVTGILIFYRTAENKINKADIDNLMTVVVISIFMGFISGMVFDKLVHFKDTKDFVDNFFKYTGITFIGGFVGGMAAYIIAFKIIFKNYTKISEYSDYLVSPFALAQGIGRFGCFFGGCCFGGPSRLGVYYPVSSEVYRMYGNTKVLPVPLIESTFLIILAFIMYKLIRKYKVLVYVLSYSAFRFFIEFFRGDNRGRYVLGIFSPSQTVCGILFILSVVIVIYKFDFKTKN